MVLIFQIAVQLLNLLYTFNFQSQLILGALASLLIKPQNPGWLLDFE